jgi:hypothetical protein
MRRGFLNHQYAFVPEAWQAYLQKTLDKADFVRIIIALAIFI